MVKKPQQSPPNSSVRALPQCRNKAAAHRIDYVVKVFKTNEPIFPHCNGVKNNCVLDLIKRNLLIQLIFRRYNHITRYCIKVLLLTIFLNYGPNHESNPIIHNGCARIMKKFTRVYHENLHRSILTSKLKKFTKYLFPLFGS